MPYRLNKKFRFEAAHRLGLNYCGKCSNIHGHSWNGSIQISGKNLDQYGFLLDFADIKIFTKMIVEMYDHKLLVHKDDIELIELCEKQNWAIRTFSQNPTSEEIARVVFKEAIEFFSKWPKIEIDFVKIEETCTSECIYDGK